MTTVWFFFFFNHPSCYSSLKISQFSIFTHLIHLVQFLIIQFFYFFVGFIPLNWSDLSVKPIDQISIPTNPQTKNINTKSKLELLLTTTKKYSPSPPPSPSTTNNKSQKKTLHRSPPPFTKSRKNPHLNRQATHQFKIEIQTDSTSNSNRFNTKTQIESTLNSTDSTPKLTSIQHWNSNRFNIETQTNTNSKRKEKEKKKMKKTRPDQAWKGKE